MMKWGRPSGLAELTGSQRTPLQTETVASSWKDRFTGPEQVATVAGNYPLTSTPSARPANQSSRELPSNRSWVATWLWHPKRSRGTAPSRRMSRPWPGATDVGAGHTSASANRQPGTRAPGWRGSRGRNAVIARASPLESVAQAASDAAGRVAEEVTSLAARVPGAVGPDGALQDGSLQDHWGSRLAAGAARAAVDAARGAAGISPEGVWADAVSAVRGLPPALSQYLSSAGGPLSADAQRLAADATAAGQATADAIAALTGDAAQIAADLVGAAQALVTAAVAPLAAPASAGAAAGAAWAAAVAAAVAAPFVDPALLSGAGDAPLVSSGALATPAFAALVATVFLAPLAALLVSRSRARNDADQPGVFDVDPELPREYNVDALAAYYAKRPGQLIGRATQTGQRVGLVALGILTDVRMGRVKENERMRARQVREACEDLGPAFVKVAQVLSTRSDILSDAYMREVMKLQDQVQPFETAEALDLMRQELGRDPSEVFASITPEPVAAASLGQVYRATLRDAYGGGEVAVKVQRPRVLERVALDLYVIREACRLAHQLFPSSVATDFSPVIDEWAVRFFREMDYTIEMQNAVRFAEGVRGLDGILVPRQYPDLTSRRLLVTQWVEGERLVDSKADDVRTLCDTLLNCYLIQLLDTGFLHADPHPGNLLRTPDGRICILDYGLMTEVDTDKQYAFVEFIGHLSTGNWAGVAQDLVNLEFAPQGYTNLLEVEGFLELIEQVLSVLMLTGGGADRVQERARSMNIGVVLDELEDMSKEYQFVIPPYFALVLRAFSVIEGIALRVDPDYAIVKECFPYLSRRLLRDPSPRMRQALRELLYDKGKRIDVERLRRLASGLSQFTTDGLTERDAGVGVGARARGGRVLDRTAVEAVKVVFAKDGSYIADLLVDELAATLHALSREAGLELTRAVLSSAAVAGSQQAVRALGPLRPIVAPLPLPSEVLARLSPAVRLTEDDRVALHNVRVLWSELQPIITRSLALAPDAANSLSGDRLRLLAEAGAELGELLPEIAPGLQRANRRLVSDLLRTTAERLVQDLDEARKMQLV